MNFKIKASARRDLREISRYLARDDRVRALEYVDEILSKIEDVAQTPLLYALREEWGPEVRMAMVKSHRILFRIETEQVLFLRIYHSARDFDQFD